MIVLYVFILFQLNQAILGWGQSSRHYVHIINPRKFKQRNLPMSTSTSMSLSMFVSMDTDTDRDMDVDMDMGRWTRTGTWTWADPRRFMYCRRRFVEETFCQETFCYKETFCYGDVLLRRRIVRRRFVEETFCKETFCMCVAFLTEDIALCPVLHICKFAFYLLPAFTIATNLFFVAG